LGFVNAGLCGKVRSKIPALLAIQQVLGCKYIFLILYPVWRPCSTIISHQIPIKIFKYANNLKDSLNLVSSTKRPLPFYHPKIDSIVMKLPAAVSEIKRSRFRRYALARMEGKAPAVEDHGLNQF
jgi:hypothetical protein